MGSITHVKINNAPPNPKAQVDSAAWNDEHSFNLTSSDVGLGNVSNTSDANKPVSTAQAAAIAAEAVLARNASNLTSGTVPVTRLSGTASALTAGNVTTNANLTGDVTSVGNATTLGKTHLVAYTVAPSGASAADKLRADFVGNGTSDQTAVAAAITAAGVTNACVLLLAGAFTFSAALTITGCNNFTLLAEDGVIIIGPTGTADTVVINGALNGSTFKFGTILTNSTGAAIHVTASASSVNGIFIAWGRLQGTSHQGKGLFFDATTGAMSVNKAEGGWISGFDKGVVMDASGTTNYVDTTQVKSLFIFDCNTIIYGRSGTARRNNSNIWDVNIDPFINGAVGIDIDHSFDRFDPVIWGDQAPSIATTFLLKLQSGASGNQFNGTPNPITTFGASLISDLSGNLTNTLDGVSIDAAINGLGQLMKFDGTVNGLPQKSSIGLGTIGAANTLTWFASANALYSLATANGGMLITDGSGVPSISTVLKLSAASGHAIGAASPGTGWGFYHSGTINATSGVAINWQTDTNLQASANGDILQGMRITATPSKGAFTGVLSYGIYIKGGSSVPYDFGIKVDDASPNYLGGPLTFKPLVSATPVNNGDLTFQATSNTSLTIKFRGSDGVVRSASLTLA